MLDWWNDVVAGVGQLTPADWAGVVGTIIAALIGIIGLARVLSAERGERETARFDNALATLMVALGQRHTDLTEWVNENFPGFRITFRTTEVTGGPPDTDLQIVLEVARMHAPRADSRAMDTLADAINALPTAKVVYQQARLGQIVTEIRAWRAGALRRRAFVARMEEIVAGADRSARDAALEDQEAREERDAAENPDHQPPAGDES